MSQTTRIQATGDIPDRVIFVGGAPRSGTSVTHALLCTAQACNAYHPEISFINPVLGAYAYGLERWAAHTSSFFREPEHFRRHIGGLVQQQLSHVCRVLSRPKVLCVKDPLMTPSFPMMHEVLDWPSQYVTVLRHPYKVIRSLQEVVEREGNVFDDDTAQFAASGYMRSYKHLTDPRMEGALLCLRYEDLNEPETIAALRAFTSLPGIDPSAIWQRGSHQTTPEEQADPWFSPKYHRAIDTSDRLPPLAPQICKVVDRVCGPIMEDYGYRQDGTFV